MKTDKSEPRKPTLAEDDELRREMLVHLVNYIHRCTELDIDFETISDLALNTYNFEVTDGGES